MAEVRVVGTLPDLESPTLVEGLPGVGLVGKIAADHLVETRAMDLVATVECDGLPDVAVFAEDEREVMAPVRLYADGAADLLVLQSDVPVSRTATTGFADCVTAWIDDQGAFPIYLSGRPVEDMDPGTVPAVTGIGVADGVARLDRIGMDRPTERGAIGGPTGALLRSADRHDLSAAGVIVETDPRFPDPAAARRVLVEAVEPIADIAVETEALVERAEEIQEQRQTLAQRMQEAGEEESSQAQPLRGFQ